MKRDKNWKEIKKIFQALSEGKKLTPKQIELWNKYNKKRGEEKL